MKAGGQLIYNNDDRFLRRIKSNKRILKIYTFAKTNESDFQASSIKTFADDASFLADKGDVVGEGDTYYNTTTCLDRFYLCGVK